MDIEVAVNTGPHELNPSLTRVLILTSYSQSLSRMEDIAHASSSQIEAVIAIGPRILEFYTLWQSFEPTLVRIIRRIHADRREHRRPSKLATVVLNGTTYSYPEFVAAMGSNLTTDEQSEHAISH